MPRFIDRNNLAQFRYYNNALENPDPIHDLIADFGVYFYYIKTNVSKKEQAERYRMVATIKRRVADALYLFDEDKERCQKEIASSDKKKQQKAFAKYMDILLVLDFFQGRVVIKRQWVQDKQVTRFADFDEKLKKYYIKYSSVPKLLLVNQQLFEEYNQFGVVTQEDFEKLNSMIPKDIHYIINIQSEDEKENAYLVERCDKTEEYELVISCMNRVNGVVRERKIKEESTRKQYAGVLLSLLDYLEEMKKYDEKKKKVEYEPKTGSKNTDSRAKKYYNKANIKIFDMKTKDDEEIEVFSFTKKHCSHRKGYEMIPHTRRGHIRRYKNGKEVYIHSSVIHKDKFNCIESAHRINK